MSSEIIIPGYLSPIPNQVYAKLESGHTEKEIILAFWRFKESTRQDVLDYILKKAVAIDLAYTWLEGLAPLIEGNSSEDTHYVTWSVRNGGETHPGHSVRKTLLRFLIGFELNYSLH